MSVEQSKGLPAWEDFAAFGDMGTLMSVCYMFEEAAEEGASIASFAGEGSYLIKRLEAQDIHSRDLLESERPGLYPKTWMAKLIAGLYVRLAEIVERPYLLPDDLPGLLIDFHKVMIAAHEIYDPRHRAKLTAEAASGAVVGHNREIAKLDRASKGIEAAIHWALRDGDSAATKTAEWVWRKLEKYDDAGALEVGDFHVFMRSEELISVHRKTNKPEGRSIKKASFGRAFARAKKSFAIAG